ncbi:MAG: hypothetical protein LBC61_04165 [Candidatus Peribacteria bacterium]|nr:hypothetical protein [Candidatus Peribacteria bacterium]
MLLLEEEVELDVLLLHQLLDGEVVLLDGFAHVQYLSGTLPKSSLSIHSS